MLAVISALDEDDRVPFARHEPTSGQSLCDARVPEELERNSIDRKLAHVSRERPHQGSYGSLFAGVEEIADHGIVVPLSPDDVSNRRAGSVCGQRKVPQAACDRRCVSPAQHSSRPFATEGLWIPTLPHRLELCTEFALLAPPQVPAMEPTETDVSARNCCIGSSGRCGNHPAWQSCFPKALTVNHLRVACEGANGSNAGPLQNGNRLLVRRTVDEREPLLAKRNTASALASKRGRVIGARA